MNKTNCTNNFRRVALATSIGLCALSGSPIQAEELNIAASAATEPAGGNCSRSMDYISGGPNQMCILQFPISIPVGHTIEQVSVLRNTAGAGSNYIYAYLTQFQLSPVYTYPVSPFWFYYTNPVSGIEIDTLMRQVNWNGVPTYPDAFPVTAGYVYYVTMFVSGATAVRGLRVTYE